MVSKREILQHYVAIARELKRFPTRTELEVIVSERQVRKYFKSLTNLKVHATRVFPDLDELNPAKSNHPLKDFTKEGLGNIIKTNNIKNGRFFITAASPTSYVDYTKEEMEQINKGKDIEAFNLHEKAFNSVLNFCKREQAELIILPMPAHVKALKKQPQHYDPRLKPYVNRFFTEYTFNKHLKALEAHINPQQINPLTGLRRLKVTPNSNLEGESKRAKTSIIVAHSKQMMEVVATGNSTHPRIIHSTGAITMPHYLRNRIGMIAKEDHVLGGLIVEIEDEVFYVRQVQMNPKDGSFIDLGTRYLANGETKKERAEAFKMGDIHPGYEAQDVLNCWYEVWKVTQPRRIFYEDWFDASSVSHHLAKKNISRYKLPKYFKSLEEEIKYCKSVLTATFNNAPSDALLYATDSNHPGHLNRYLEEGRYIHDDANYELAHRMVVLALDGKNPLKEYLDPEGRMTWLDVNDDYFVEGVQLGAHGHLGVNGAKAAKAGLELAYANAMVAHSHTPGIYHQLFVVGHSSKDRHGYNDGPSTWIPCSGLVYKGGAKQLIMVIGGKWRKSK